MNRKRSTLALLAIQLALVLSIAGKYLYERHAYPRVWTPATQVDPSLPMRGRYLALNLQVDACSLPRQSQYFVPVYGIPSVTMNSTPTAVSGWSWLVTFAAVNGRLEPQIAANPRTATTERISLKEGEPCDRAWAGKTELYFIPDRAKGPFPLKPGQELWVEVTLPPSGPPRPIQLALSSGNSFQPLKFE